MPLTIVKHSPANHPSGLLLCRHTPKRALAWSSAMVARPEMAPGLRGIFRDITLACARDTLPGHKTATEQRGNGGRKARMQFFAVHQQDERVFLRTFVPQRTGQQAGLPLAHTRKRKGERKVRAAQGIPLPNRKRLARACRCRRKQPPCLGKVRVRRWGKSPPGQW